MPTLDELGSDLLTTTARQRRVTLLRPALRHPLRGGHNLAELSRRLDPFLERHGVRVWRVL